MWTFYDELGVKKTATAKEIEQAYRILARKFHPDRNPGREAEAKARFIRIQEAYEVLSSPALRIEYDETFEAGQHATDISLDRAPFVDLESQPVGRPWRRSYGAHTIWLISAVIILGILMTLVLLSRSRHEDKPLTAAGPAQATNPLPLPTIPTVAPGLPTDVIAGAGRVPVGASGGSNENQLPQIPATFAGVSSAPTQFVPQSVRPKEAIRSPVPSDVAQAAARKQITELYTRDLDSSLVESDASPVGEKAARPSDRQQLHRRKSQLAVKLLSLAIDTDDEPAKYVLCNLAAELAAEVGDCGTAFKALAEMGRSFEIDLLPKKTTAVALAAKWASTAAEHKDVSRHWLALVADAVNQDLYPQAQAYLASATSEAESTPDKIFRRILQDSALQLREMIAAYDVARHYQETLSRDPQDDEAAHAWGKYLCLYKNDWARGLPLWASQPSQGAQIAHQDFDNPSDPGQQIGLAVAWQDAARQEHDSLPRRTMSMRAALWYGRAIPKLAGDLQGPIELRLQEIANQLSPVGAGETIDLLAIAEPELDAISGIWREADGELIAHSEPGQFLIPMAISRDGCYELALEFTHRGRFFRGGEFLVFPAGDADWSIVLQSRGAPTPSGAALTANYRGSAAGAGRSAPLPELAANRRHTFKVGVEIVGKKAKIHCELDGKSCFDGEEPLPAIRFSDYCHLQDGAIVLCASAEQTSGVTVFHSIRLRMSTGSARPLADVAGYKLGMSAAAAGGERNRPSVSSHDATSDPAPGDLTALDPLAGIETAAFVFVPFDVVELSSQ